MQRRTQSAIHRTRRRSRVSGLRPGPTAIVEALDRRLLFSSGAPVFDGTPTYAVDPDGSAAFLVEFTDPDSVGETHTVSSNWSDGPPSVGIVDEPTGAAGKGTAYGRHVYTAPGSYPVTVTVTDSTGLSASGTFTAVFEPPSTSAVEPDESLASGDLLAAPYGDSPAAFSSVAAADETAPQVQAVFVDSTAWTPEFRSYLADNGLGDDGFFVGSGAAQLLALPWKTINQVKVRFSEPVTVVTEDLLLNGVNVPRYGFAGAVSYNATTSTATWTLAADVAADKLLVHLRNTITDAALNELNGDWTDGSSAFPSGDNPNSSDGADNLFQYRINFLPGDVTRGDTVNVIDTEDTRQRSGTSTTNPGSGGSAYRGFNDIDGSGAIDGFDVTDVRNRSGDLLPAAAPASPTLPTGAPSQFTGAINWYETLMNTLDSQWTYSGTGQHGFVVERSLDGAAGWTKLSPINDPAARTGRHDKVGRKFYYRVRAVNEAGASLSSNYAWPVFLSEDREVKVSVKAEPNRIVLSWPARPDATMEPDGTVNKYVVKRKLRSQLTYESWTTIADLPATATGWTDATAQSGVPYEYWIHRQPRYVGGHPLGPDGMSYVSAGIGLWPVQSRGDVLLVVERTLLNDAELATKIQRLEADLTADGWNVIRMKDSTGAVIDAPRHVEEPRAGDPAKIAAYKAGVAEVKSFIVGEYNRLDANVKSVLLLGRVPVPYSGIFATDNHPEHVGAWPADVYYGDVDGHWTDGEDPSVPPADTRLVPLPRPRAENVNIPDDPDTPDVDEGDGKFDQDDVPDDGDGPPVELQVGRVDFSRMPLFEGESEIFLLKRYLDKNHMYRRGEVTVPRRALIDDNFSQYAAGQVSFNVFGDLSSLVGPENVEAGEFFDRIQDPSSDGYLWASGNGPGLPPWSLFGDTDPRGQSVDGVGSTGQYIYRDPMLPPSQRVAAPPSKAVFTTMDGSFVADWDIPNSILRAPLAAAGYGLAALVGQAPTQYTHRMASGGTIGDSLLATQNNNPFFVSYGDHRNNPVAHVALMGDPTLRLHYAKPVTQVTKVSEGNGVRLQWTAPTEPGAFAYYVFVQESTGGPFILREDTPESATSYLHANGSMSSTYMIRAVRLEDQANSGSYYNLSSGVYV